MLYSAISQACSKPIHNSTVQISYFPVNSSEIREDCEMCSRFFRVLLRVGLNALKFDYIRQNNENLQQIEQYLQPIFEYASPQYAKIFCLDQVLEKNYLTSIKFIN